MNCHNITELKKICSIYKNHFLSSFLSSLIISSIISSFIILILHMYHYLSNVIFLMYMYCEHSWFLCTHCILLSLYHHGLREINKLKIEIGIIFDILGSIWPFLHYIINQKRNDFYGTSFPPWYKTPLIPNMCINIVNIMWEWGLVSRGGGERCLKRQKINPKMWGFLSLLFYIINRVPWHFPCTILHEIWQISFILSTYNLPTRRMVYFDKF